MNPQERQLVLEQLATSEARLLALTANLTPDQWHFRETPSRWSIAEVIEHIIVWEKFLTGVVQNALGQPPAPEKSTLEKDPLVHNIANGRDTKFNAREATLPTNRWPDTGDLIAEFRKTRANTIAFVTSLDAHLRTHFFPHVALGDLDCYQWLIVMAQHGARHAFQIEEIKAHPGYPAATY